MGKIEYQAKEILKKFPQVSEIPCSLSGAYHLGETLVIHVERTANVMRYLCDSHKIEPSDRDMLIAAAYLHDIGNLAISTKGKVEDLLWEYHKETDWSRIKCLHRLHPLISAQMLEHFEIDRKSEIQTLVSCHMGHWYSHCPQPKNLYEHLIVIADYLASRKENIFNEYGK